MVIAVADDTVGGGVNQSWVGCSIRGSVGGGSKSAPVLQNQVCPRVFFMTDARKGLTFFDGCVQRFFEEQMCARVGVSLRCAQPK